MMDMAQYVPFAFVALVTTCYANTTKPEQGQ